MTISSRTPEGQPGRCPICRANVIIEPSLFFGDAPCPSCGHLLWFVQLEQNVWLFEGEHSSERKSRVLRRIADQLGVDAAYLADHPSLMSELGADSLDFVELIMELDEELDP